MIERLRFLFLLTLLTAIVGCEPEKNKETYFGGKIINPKSDHVVLYYQQKVIDTFQLDASNNFLSKIDIKKEGLFYFKHGREHQYIYLEPQDSILIRLNTWNFDESLVFSGKGADRNNMLIDCFIDSEKDKRKFYKFYGLSPREFKSQISRIEDLKMQRYNQFILRNKSETEQFKKILKMALTYPVYSKVENYPLARKEQQKEINSAELDTAFYRHRKSINIDRDSIMFFYAYRDYMISHMYNKVLTNENFDLDSDQFTIKLLGEINSNIGYENTKNTLLRQTTISHFYRKSTCEVNPKTFDTFFEMSSNERDKKWIRNLLNDVNSVHKGKKIAPFQIVDYNKAGHNIRSVIKGKNSVIYFWNPRYISKDYVASKIRYLSKKHPKVNFVGIRIYDGKTERIRKLDIKKQFYLHKDSDANKFLTSNLPRTILINKKGIVVNGFASLSSQNIYQQVGELAKN